MPFFFLTAIALYNLNLFFSLGIAAAPFYVLHAAFIIVNTTTIKGLMVVLLELFVIHRVDPISLSWPLHAFYVIGTVVLCGMAFQRARKGDRPARMVARSFIGLFVGLAHAGHFAKLYRDAFGRPPKQDLRAEASAAANGD